MVDYTTNLNYVNVTTVYANSQPYRVLKNFTEDKIGELAEILTSRPKCIIFVDSETVTRILASQKLSNLYYPVVKLEELTNGRVGILLGSTVFTDSYMESNAKFIKDMEIRILK